MVDSINNSMAARVRLQPTATDAANPSTAGATQAGRSNNAPVSAVDQVVLSGQIGSTQINDLVEKGPPFDIERVSRIREAVSEGRYPVDASRIAEAMFQDFASFANR